MTTGGARRRGRRAGGVDTRAALLAAAQEVFGEQGYSGATVRAIAGRAGVDPAMVNHWFGGKSGLFAEAVLDLPMGVEAVLERLRAVPVERLGATIVWNFVTVWDAPGGADRFSALIRSASGPAQAAESLRDFLLANLFGPIGELVAGDRRELRANLVASQMIGLGVARYVARFEPLAGTDVDGVVAAVGPTVQRYLTGELG
ncbi:TetR family transcriptional regulator [Actinokineospora sp. G85]|uniref:TetR/AcrR family transcriptional regulator n=1 Tax=Actinokineospora sp. G85 TaxID=3406626 RepID=UPI003C773E93